MPRIVFAGSVFAILFAANANFARASEGPWCAILNFGADISEDCQYRSLEECLPAITSGFRGFCNPNPRWNGVVGEQRMHRKRSVWGQ